MDLQKYLEVRTRRQIFKDLACGIGAFALGSLLQEDGWAAVGDSLPNPLAPKKPHFPGKAKSVIFLFMEGGPSQMDLLDPKPALQKFHGNPAPPSIVSKLQLAFTKPNAAILASPREFKKHGQCGMEISDWLPHTATVADDICLVR